MADRSASRAVWIGTILVSGSALLIGWARRHRTPRASAPVDPVAMRVEGGI